MSPKWVRVAIITWDALLLLAFVGFWLAQIWTSGNDPLSIRLGGTAFVLLILLILSLFCSLPFLEDEDA